MSLSALILIVLAALLHASWNLLAKRAASAGAVFVSAYNLVACVVYAPWVVYLLAQGGFNWSWAVLGVLFLNALLHLAYSLCLQRGYQVADFSVVYPIARGTGPMLSSIGAFLVLRELPTGKGLAGLALVIIGIGLIATAGDLSAFRRPRGASGVRWGIATGGLIACYTVSDAYVVKVLAVAPVLLDWFSNAVRFILLGPIVLADRRRAADAMRGLWWTAVGVGVLSPLSYILVLAALSSGAPLRLVAPMREMSMMVGALMGLLILRERVNAWRIVGCGVLIAGVAILSRE